MPNCNLQNRENSIWKRVVTTLDSATPKSIDFAELEKLFGQAEVAKKSIDAADSIDKSSSISRKDSIITFLDTKKSMNLNITLKAFKCEPQQVALLLKECSSKELSIDNLRSLMKVLPDSEEVGLD